MNLDQLTIEIRPRRAWESIDLGLLMARRWWWPMLQVWLLLTLPLLALLFLLPKDWIWLSYLLLWWLKPLFERPLLHILSQAVFNQTPNTRSTLKAFLGLAWKQFILSLGWRRLSPTRSMDLPVIQLEGLRGNPRAERLKILHREDSTPSSWLTAIGFAIECFLALGLAMLLYLLIPEEVNLNQVQIFTSEGLGWLVLLICYYLAQALVAPFYVACGFSLYLNRRIKLEAWDIDIAFQRIVNKRKSPSNHGLLALLLGLTLGTASLYQAPPVLADTNTGPELMADKTATDELQAPYNRASAKTTIDELINGADFKQKTIVRYPSFFDSDEPKSKKAKNDTEEESALLEWLLKFLGSGERISSIAGILEVLFWALVLCLVFLLVFRYRHWLASYLPQSAPQLPTRTKPLTLFGLDLSQESLPDNISASALDLWRNGKDRAALALLYRASLSRLLDAGLEIEQGHTEAECLQVAHNYAQHNPRSLTAINYFAELTSVWRNLAYGHLTPDAEQAERLCQTWNGVWQPDASAQQQGASHE